MKLRLLALGVLAVMVLSVSPLAAQKAPKVDPKKQINSDTMNPGEYTGKVLTTPTSSGDFVVRIEFQHPDPASMGKNYTNNRNISHQQNLLMQAQNQAMQAQQQMANARTPQQANSAQQHMNQAMMKMQQAQMNIQNTLMQGQMKAAANVKMINDHVDIEFHQSPEMIVRTANPPQAFDEKGNPKKYTTEELKTLKGTKHPNLAGYEADISALQPNQVVKVTLAKRPATPKKTDTAKPAETTGKTEAPAAPGGDKEKPKDADPLKDTPLPNSKTWVTKIIIESDPDSAVDNKTNPKKNK
jgi:hypothetical protein